MKSTRDAGFPARKASPGPIPELGRPRRKRFRVWRGLGIVLLVLALVLGIGRAMLPWAVRNYVNRTLDRNPLYEGNIGKVQIHLLRGAYSIEDVSINKTTGKVVVPFRVLIVAA